MHGLDAQTIAPLQTVLADGGALGEAFVGHHEQVLVGVARHHIHRQQAVVRTELHALHTGGLTAHRAQLLVIGLELETHAKPGHQDDVVLRVAQRGADELVGVLAVLVGHESHGDQTALTRGIVLGQRGLLDLAGSGGEHQISGHLIVRDGQHGLDGLIGRELQQVGHMLALGIARAFG